MALITNPQAIHFANDRARIIANALQTLDRSLAQFALDVVILFETPTTSNIGGDIINDGSSLDGRNPVTKTNVAELKYVLEQITACMSTDDRRAIVNRWAVNSTPLF